MARRDRAALLEAKQHCYTAIEGMKTGGVNTSETVEILTRIEAALSLIAAIRCAANRPRMECHPAPAPVPVLPTSDGKRHWSNNLFQAGVFPPRARNRLLRPAERVWGARKITPGELPRVRSWWIYDSAVEETVLLESVR